MFFFIIDCVNDYFMEILILFLVISSANKIIKFKITKNLYKYFSNSNKISNIFQICFNPILKV